MTEAELLEVSMNLSDAMNSQFEFWLTITFAFIMAIHFTGNTISTGRKRLLLGLYSVTSLFITLRFIALASNGGSLIARMQESGYEGLGSIIPNQGAFTILPLIGIMIVGTIAALYYSKSEAPNDT